MFFSRQVMSRFLLSICVYLKWKRTKNRKKNPYQYNKLARKSVN